MIGSKGLTQKVHVGWCDELGAGYPLDVANGWSRRDQQFRIEKHIPRMVTKDVSIDFIRVLYHLQSHTGTEYID